MTSRAGRRSDSALSDIDDDILAAVKKRELRRQQILDGALPTRAELLSGLPPRHDDLQSDVMGTIDDWKARRTGEITIDLAASAARGRSELSVELERFQERMAVDAWCDTFTYQPGSIRPLWETDPARFYLSLDGEPRASFALRHPSISLIRVRIAELLPKLQYASGRDETPAEQWEKRSKTKTLGYRWHLGRAVSPPFLTIYDGTEISIVGGMHRVHLAAAEGAAEIPALVDASDLATLMTILPHSTAWT